MGTLCFLLVPSISDLSSNLTLIIHSQFLSLWLQISTATEQSENLVCHKAGSSVCIVRVSPSIEEDQN